MITGDPRLSPNNSVDIKACTDKANMNGEKVKVILISSAEFENEIFNQLLELNFPTEKILRIYSN